MEEELEQTRIETRKTMVRSTESTKLKILSVDAEGKLQFQIRDEHKKSLKKSM